jgi:hypothetical protein
MDIPKRIQRKRVKGWRMPEGAIYVGRPTAWGNPFIVGEHGDAAECVWWYRHLVGTENWPKVDDIRECLRGHDLACWCPLDQPCHADVLLELANK